MLSAKVARNNNYLSLKTSLSIEASSVDQDQTAPIRVVLSLVYMHNLHPGAILLPGAKLHPGVNLHPLM